MNIKDFIQYEPETGVLTWAVSKGRASKGLIAGGLHKHGYRRLSFDGKEYLCHRIAWEFVHGEIPSGCDIDHINGNRSDNRISNIRAVSRSVNAQNRKGAAAHNKTGLLGVAFHKATGKFRALIRTNKSVTLGYFATPEEAHSVYMEAKKRMHIGNEACVSSGLATQANLTILETFIQASAA